MKISTLAILMMLLVVPALLNAGERSPSPDAADLYIISPQDGDLIKGEFRVLFGLNGMGVAPAGVNQPNSGHHHLLIDMKNLPIIDAPLPKTDQLRHFGGGQTETTLRLPPGIHTLQLLLADYSHTPHEPVVISEKITITVIE